MTGPAISVSVKFKIYLKALRGPPPPTSQAKYNKHKKKLYFCKTSHASPMISYNFFPISSLSICKEFISIKQFKTIMFYLVNDLKILRFSRDKNTTNLAIYFKASV